jgi:hypothetical protein
MTRTFFSVLTVCCLAAAIGVSACGDGPSEPTPGIATVSLTSPATDGAILLTVSGSGLTEPKPSNPSLRIYWRLVSPTEMRMAVFGAIAAGPLFTIDVLDVGSVKAYQGTVLQVADRNDQLRADLSGYSLTATSTAG